jgi:hypothetical protein
MSDFELIEDEMFAGSEPADVGDDTVCSKFSDVTIGQYGSATAGGDGGGGLEKRSPVKVCATATVTLTLRSDRFS